VRWCDYDRPWEAALDYLARGWQPVHMAISKKGPVNKGWQHTIYTPETARKQWATPANIGINLGKPSGGLVDVDQDVPESAMLAPYFLPATELVSGRPGAPSSHWWYVADPLPSTTQYRDPVKGGPIRRDMLVELRSTGGQTIVEPSIHPSGEHIVWEKEGGPTLIRGDELIQHVNRLAAASLLVRHWPNQGGRHHAALALAGALAHAGWDEEDAAHFIRAVVTVAGDPEAEDRIDSVRTSFRTVQSGNKATGIPTLTTLIPKAAVDAIVGWLGLGNKHTGHLIVGKATYTEATPAQDTAETAPQNTRPVKADESLPRAPRDFVEACLDEEELGDGRLFAYLYRDRVIYDHSEKEFYIWQRHWELDRISLSTRLMAGQVASQYLHVAADLTTEAEALPSKSGSAAKLRSRADKLISRAHALRKLNRTRNALSFASSLLGITGDEWDQDPDLLGVKNGVVDLKDGELYAARPGDYIRTVAPTEWTGIDTPAPRWERFIAEILEQEDDQASRDLPPFLQRLLGYGITGHRLEHVLPVWWGIRGRNGKDTLLETSIHVLGPVAEPISTDVLLARSDHRGGSAQPHIMDLRGKRLVWASETNEGARLNSGQVKQLSGGGTIKSRQLFGKMVSFSPTHLIMLVTNSKPHAPSDDDALWSRIVVLPFTQRFVDNPVEANEHPRDPRLAQTLMGEASGILAWLVRGTLAWRKQGLCPPECVRLATKAYRVEEDLIAQFIDECCIKGDDLEALSHKLYQAYKDWVGKDDKGVTNIAFGKQLAQLFPKERRSKGVFYQGIGLPGELSTPKLIVGGTG